jgi:hypothetical protein
MYVLIHQPALLAQQAIQVQLAISALQAIIEMEKDYAPYAQPMWIVTAFNVLILLHALFAKQAIRVANAILALLDIIWQRVETPMYVSPVLLSEELDAYNVQVLLVFYAQLAIQDPAVILA